MSELSSHKRSKSSIALSKLRGSNKSTKDDNASDAGSAVTSPSGQNLSVPDRGGRRKSLDQSAEQAASYDTPVEPSASTQSLVTAEKTAPSGLDDQKMSIEDSVKTFKLFEVLRSGDLAAVQAAVRDSKPSNAAGTTVLHLATQCAEPHVVDYVIQNTEDLNINARDREGNTALHLASQLGRMPVIRKLLEQPGVNDGITNRQGQTAIDLARTPDIFQQLHLARSLFLDRKVSEIHSLVASGDTKKLEELLVEPRVEELLDVNGLELATDQITVQSGGTLLHEAARKKDIALIQALLMHGADPFRRDRKGKLPQDVTKDDRTKQILKKSPAAVIAQRGIQEKAILGSKPSGAAPAGSVEARSAPKEGREIKGYLKKWTNYTSGYKLRWFVLEDEVLSYYKHQDDAGSACRGAINMKIARLHMDPSDKTRFEIHGKSSVKYHLKANHVVEAKRWFWALNNAIQYSKDEAKEDERRRTKDSEKLRHIKNDSLSVEAAGSSTSLSRTTSRQIPPQLATSFDPNSASRVSFQASALGPDSAAGDDTGSVYGDSYEPSLVINDLNKTGTAAGTATLDGEDDEMADDSSSREVKPANKDAFNITAQSARLQLDLLSHVSSALAQEVNTRPETQISNPSITSALTTYDSAVSNLSSLLGDLLKISRDRDAYWQYRLDREADARRMWEDSMARVVKEHEDLQRSIDVSEQKRKKTKRALKEALENTSRPPSRPSSQALGQSIRIEEVVDKLELGAGATASVQDHAETSRAPGARRRSLANKYADLSDSGSDDDEEFFDAVDAGEIEIVTPPSSPPPTHATSIADITETGDTEERDAKTKQLIPSYKGYEDPVRKRLKMDADDRPKISLWVSDSPPGRSLADMEPREY